FYDHLTHRPPTATLFPYTTLFRSCRRHNSRVTRMSISSKKAPMFRFSVVVFVLCLCPSGLPAAIAPDNLDCVIISVRDQKLMMTDRKSTRLNSSHGSISYAVFCLK